jgi:hypothetical protein
MGEAVSAVQYQDDYNGRGIEALTTDGLRGGTYNKKIKNKGFTTGSTYNKKIKKNMKRQGSTYNGRNIK